MLYTFEVAGISHKNTDGEPRREIVIDNLHPDYSGIEVSFRRHSGNRSDKNAVGVYIEGRYTEPVMIGFLPRDLAKDVSPMMKLGHVIDDIKITRVWVPNYSDVAAPVVVISFEGGWTRNDINNYKKQVSEERKLARSRRIDVDANTQHTEIKNKKSNPSIFSRLLSFLKSPIKK